MYTFGCDNKPNSQGKKEMHNIEIFFLLITTLQSVQDNGLPVQFIYCDFISIEWCFQCYRKIALKIPRVVFHKSRAVFSSFSVECSIIRLHILGILIFSLLSVQLSAALKLLQMLTLALLAALSQPLFSHSTDKAFLSCL